MLNINKEIMSIEDIRKELENEIARNGGVANIKCAIVNLYTIGKRIALKLSYTAIQYEQFLLECEEVKHHFVGIIWFKDGKWLEFSTKLGNREEITIALFECPTIPDDCTE